MNYTSLINKHHAMIHPNTGRKPIETLTILLAHTYGANKVIIHTPALWYSYHGNMAHSYHGNTRHDTRLPVDPCVVRFPLAVPVRWIVCSAV